MRLLFLVTLLASSFALAEPGGFRWDSTNPAIPIKARADVDLNGYSFKADDENFTINHTGTGGIQFVDGSEGTSGHCWLSQDVFGTGGWAECPAMGLSNVVEDTTPQLGGDLDLNTFSILDGATKILHRDGGADTFSVGPSAGDSLTTSIGLTLVGQDAGSGTTTANNAVYVGRDAGKNANSTDSVIIGSGAAQSVTGARFIAIGKNAGLSASSASDAVIIGDVAGDAISTASRVVFVGSKAGTNHTAPTSGSSNSTAIGFEAGTVLTTGKEVTIIGADADLSSGTLTNATVIGFNATVDASNKFRFGNDSVTVYEYAPGATIQPASGDLNITSAAPELSKKNSDPCGTLTEGTMFYNDTSNYMCYCDGTNDVQVHSPATACF